MELEVEWVELEGEGGARRLQRREKWSLEMERRLLRVHYKTDESEPLPVHLRYSVHLAGKGVQIERHPCDDITELAARTGDGVGGAGGPRLPGDEVVAGIGGEEEGRGLCTAWLTRHLNLV